MILRMYSVYDLKSKIYHPPMYFHNAGHAMRGFQQQFRKPGSMMHDYPEDFNIFDLGAYDDQTGTMETLKNPTFICSVSDLVEAAKETTDAENDRNT